MRQWLIRERVAGPDDNGIRALMGRCYPAGGVSWDRFRHWYFGIDQSTAAIVVAEADGDIVGMQPLQLVPHRLEGQALLAGILTGVMVDPGWRRMGIFSDLIGASERIAFSSGAEIVWTMPNARSKPGFKKLGYIFPGERRLLIWSNKPERLVGGKTRGMVSRVLSPLVGALVGRTPRLRGKPLVEEVPELGRSASQVASVLAGSWVGVVQDRTETWIRWRFGKGMDRPYRFLQAAAGPDDAPGWAVITREERKNLAVGYILDFAGRDHLVCAEVLGHALQALASWGVDLVMCVASGRGMTRLLMGVGMVPVPAVLAPKRFFLAFRAAPGCRTELVNKLRSVGCWHTTLADWDTL